MPICFHDSLGKSRWRLLICADSVLSPRVHLPSSQHLSSGHRPELLLQILARSLLLSDVSWIGPCPVLPVASFSSCICFIFAYPALEAVHAFTRAASSMPCTQPNLPALYIPWLSSFRFHVDFPTPTLVTLLCGTIVCLCDCSRSVSASISLRCTGRKFGVGAVPRTGIEKHRMYAFLIDSIKGLAVNESACINVCISSWNGISNPGTSY